MKQSKWVVLLLLGIAICGIPLAQIVIFAFMAIQPGNSAAVYLDIHKGDSPHEITHLLQAQGIIQDDKSFVWVGRLTRQWKHVKAGEYKFSPSMNPIEIFSTLTSGISAAHPVTVREGENMYEIADDLAVKGLANKEHFIGLCKSSQFIISLGYFKYQPPPTLEGYFFPDTYFFNKAMNDVEMIKQMVHHFFTFWGKAEEERAKQLGMDLHQVITLASIIEKETGAPEERALISSVFHNRLHKGMKLQSDPTTIYGMWSRYKGKIHKRDLLEKSPYNTYYVPALPIGPISNPGKDAIHAALFPATSPYYYFVSHNDGTHQFSRTMEEHNQAVRHFQLDPKARQGKSWRDHLRRPAKATSASKSHY